LQVVEHGTEDSRATLRRGGYCVLAALRRGGYYVLAVQGTGLLDGGEVLLGLLWEILLSTINSWGP